MRLGRLEPRAGVGLLFDAFHKDYALAIEGTFLIRVEGRASTRAAGVNVKGLFDQRVKMIDPDVDLYETNFGGINFVYEWKGIPYNLDKAQMIFGYLKNKMQNYFIGWKINIEIHLIESGG